MSSTTNRKTTNTRQEPGTGKRPGNMIRVPDATHSILRELADETGQPMQELLVEAVEAMRRRRMFELANAAYAAMRENEDEWQEELRERRLWDMTLADGLEDE
ncbi:MAG: toxin-antitoxin system protein [Chloroflexota bacterium]|nr:toxin-antitoxin system protein [Chloroflexota bacterium]